MGNLTIRWLALFSIGLPFIAVDVAYRPLMDVNGVPAVAVIGAALIVLVMTTRLDWVFKEAWIARNGLER
jgi:hypothetical protein